MGSLEDFQEKKMDYPTNLLAVPVSIRAPHQCTDICELQSYVQPKLQNRPLKAVNELNIEMNFFILFIVKI